MRKNIFLIAMMAAVLSSTVTGCTKFSEDFSEEVEMQNPENQEEGLISKAESRMKNFITAVNTQNYEEITEMIDMPENAFVTDKHVEWYITRTALADITGVKINRLSIDVNEGALKKKVEVYVNKEGYAFDMVLDGNNEWKIVLPDLYVENWTLKVPKGCSATVDDKDISIYKLPDTEIENYDTYRFPAIAKEQEYLAKAISSIYGDFTQKIKPISNSETIPVICVLNDDETTSILKHIKDIWNGMYKDYKNLVGAEAVKKYFTDDFDNSEITNIMTLYFPQLETGPTEKEVGEIRYDNFYMKEIKPRNSSENYGCAILKSDNAVEVNFSYCLDFASPITSGIYSVKKHTKITMAYVDAPELGEGAKTYKIKELNEIKLFTDNDYKSNDY